MRSLNQVNSLKIGWTAGQELLYVQVERREPLFNTKFRTVVTGGKTMARRRRFVRPIPSNTDFVAQNDRIWEIAHYFTMKRELMRRATIIMVICSLMLCGYSSPQPSLAKDAIMDLMEFAGQGRYEEVKVSIERGTDVNARDSQGRTALMSASEKGHVKVVKLLLDRGASVNAQVDIMGTALMMAAYNGHLPVVKVLLDRGADMYARNKFGWTALIGACYAQRLDVAKELLQRPRSEQSQLFVRACAEGHLDDVRSLLTQSADVNSRTLDGLTALAVASVFGHTKVIQLLLNNGAKIDDPNDDGSTPLMGAAVNNRLDVVELLLDRGADIDARDKFDYTALYLAKIMGHKRIQEVLEKRGAR